MSNTLAHNHTHSHSHSSRPRFESPAGNRAPEKAYRVETVRDAEGHTEVLSVRGTTQTVRQDEVVLRSQPLGFGEHGEKPSVETYTESYVAESALSDEQKARLENDAFETKAEWAGSEVRTIVDQGPSDNRIDLTIVGDGYTDIPCFSLIRQAGGFAFGVWDPKHRNKRSRAWGFIEEGRVSNLNQARYDEDAELYQWLEEALASVAGRMAIKARAYRG